MNRYARTTLVEAPGQNNEYLIIGINILEEQSTIYRAQ